VDSELADAYAYCRALHRRYGRTYFLATRLLPADKRPHVHALYGFTRYADEIVDDTTRAGPADRARALRTWAEQFRAGLAGTRVEDPILPAVLHTIDVFALDREDFTSFLTSMAMDLEVTRYDTYEELLGYMEGSAAVIGTMMLPILGAADRRTAREPARQLGLAFQLTNFIRDIGEDLERGRIYLPGTDLRRFGVTEADLRTASVDQHANATIQALVRFEVERAREHYAAAAPGITMLARTSQACIRTAFHLYGGILDEIERAEYDPFVRRAVVPTRRRLRVAMRSMGTPAGTPAVLTTRRAPIVVDV
jgi:15-cis-phytoene synthase